MWHITGLAVFLLALLASDTLGADWPTLGRDRSRNSVSPERKPPLNWHVKGGWAATGTDSAEKKDDDLNVRWTAQLPGGRTFGAPVVSDGLIWIGTSLGHYANGQKPGGSLCCFREIDGALIYERRSEALLLRVHDTGWTGLGASPLLEDDSLWYVTNRWEVVCLDVGPLRRNEGPPRDRWVVDLAKEFGVFPRSPLMGPPRHCSIAPSLGDRIFITTGNGVDEGYSVVPAPLAPALVCLDKNTGKTLWTDRSPGRNVHFTETASPLVAEIAGRAQAIVPQGDGWLRSFDPTSGKILWKFDLNRKEVVLATSGRGNRNHSWSSPVLYEGRIYVTTGQNVEHGEGPGRLVCLDPTKNGDISSELAVDRQGKTLPERRVQAVIPKDGERGVPNPNSGLIWEFGAVAKIFDQQFHRSISSVAIQNGLLTATDFSGLVHCLDARTGKWHWSHDLFAACWTTPLVVAGHVFVCDEDGDVAILRLSPEPAVAPLVEINMGTGIYASPIYSNGTLYVATQEKLFAIGRGRESRVAKAIFIPTPHDVVAKMLKLAVVTDKDLVVDLGSGDGRILIAAAKVCGAQAVGYEIDRELVRFSRARIQQADSDKLIAVHEQDFFTADFSAATVVTAFLYPAVLEKLKPQFGKLKPGTRIVTHTFAIPDAAPDDTVEFKLPDSGDLYRIYLYKTPLRKPPAQATP